MIARPTGNYSPFVHCCRKAKQQAIDLFNQLPSNLNSTQAREQSLLAVEVKLAQNDYQGAQKLLAKLDPTALSTISRRATGRRKLMPARANLR
jgi:outer membrane PBP1 activator LpoA protein